MPDDKDDYELYSQAAKMHSVLYDLSKELRSCNKHGSPTDRDKFWSERFWELMRENDVELI